MHLEVPFVLKVNMFLLGLLKAGTDSSDCTVALWNREKDIFFKR